MFRAAILLFLILTGVVIAWLPSDFLEEDVISKYRTNQNTMNQTLLQKPEKTTKTNTQKIPSTSSIQTKEPSKTIPVSNIAANSSQIPVGNTIEQRSNSQRALPPPSIDKRTLHPLYELFEKTGTSSQFYDIDNQQTNTLVSNNGALINIPPNCFMQRDGSMVMGNITIEVKEINSKSEHLLSNITTNTFNSLLSSGGLIYINAYSHEQNLKIAPQKLVYVEMPTSERDGDQRAFFAEFDKKGQSWWSKSMPQINRMISLPLQQIAFEEMELNESLKNLLSQAKFEQTFIATRAFEERLYTLQKYQDLFSIEDVVNIYTHYIEADLKESDNKAAYYFKQLALKKQDTQPAITQKLYSLASHFQGFAAERYTKPMFRTPYGINLDDPNAFNQLLGKGMSTFTANMYLQMNHCRKHLMAERSKNKKTFADNKRPAKNTFMIHHTGWFSINEFLPTNTPKRKMMAQISSDQDSKASLYLVLDDYNTVVAASKDKEGNYHFANLPLGANGRLVALSHRHNQPYIDIQDITVGETYLHSLQMRPTTIEMMQYEISQLDYETHLSASL